METDDLVDATCATDSPGEMQAQHNKPTEGGMNWWERNNGISVQSTLYGNKGKQGILPH